MKKSIIILLIVLIAVSTLFLGSFAQANSANNGVNTNDIINDETKSQLVDLRDSELQSMEDYKQAYGSDVTGVVAYVLNKIRLWSIPLGFVAIAISAIYQYVIGIKHLENRDKGLNSMIVVVTLFVICQILPLIYTIIIKFRG